MTESPVLKNMAIDETLHPVNDDISIIGESLFPSTTALQPPKVGILQEIYPSGGLVIDFPCKELISSARDE
uniref:Uncharacterized protein n=1 Tax=Romanomermis culicivorax TaxID=13658 RepID=A0A915I0B9_ROMCU